MKRFMNVLFAMLITFCIAGGAHATPLSDLFNGGSITAGDKLFDHWSLVNYTASDSTRLFNAANIDVTALNDGGMNPGPGLKFTVLNNELSVTGDGFYAYVDLMFGFRASVLDPSLKIVGNSLELTNGFVTNVLDDGFYIHEDIGATAGGSNLGTNEVEFSWLDPDLISNLTDSTTFSMQSEIWVTKNILVWSSDNSETASLEGFDQRFSQTPAVPEPSTLFLLGGGLAGLAVLRKKMAGRAK